MAFTFIITKVGIHGNERYARGTWDSSAGGDTGGIINTPLGQVDGFSAASTQNVSFSVNPGALVTDIDILHAAGVRDGTWMAWGS